MCFQPRTLLLILFSLFCFLSLKAQDKIMLKYPVGVSSLDSVQRIYILNTIHSYSNYSIDSITIKGFADSLGNQKANMELSKDRAKEVMHYMKKAIPYRVKFKYYAVGETDKKIETTDRRVEVFIYTKEQINDTTPDIISVFHPKCITSAYDVLAVSRRFVVKKKREEFVILEMETNHCLSRKKIKDSLYYAIVKNDTNVNYVKVKWRKKTTGLVWYARARYQTEIPKNAFDKFSVFYLSDLPCKTCGYIIGDSNMAQPKIDTCTVYDALVSYNIQYKTSLFNSKTVEARVPKEFVSSFNNYSYFYNGTNVNVVWRTKLGRKNRPYYFLTLPLYKHNEINPNYTVPLLQKREPCCLKVDSFHYFRFWICGWGQWGSYLNLSVEVGAYHISKNIIPYFGIGVYKEIGRSQYNIMAGLDGSVKLIANVRYQYNYATLPLNMINPFAGWGTSLLTNSYFLRFYMGSAVTSGNLKNVGGFICHDIHSGISLASESKFIKRIFVQYGYAYDYLGNMEQSFSPVLNYGLIFKL